MEAEAIVAGLAQSRDLVALVDLSFEIVFMSEGVADVLGFEPAAMIGRAASDFFHPDERSLFTELADGAVSDGHQPDAATLLQLLHADGGFVTVEVLAGVALDGAEPAGFWVVGRTPRRAEVHATVLHRLLERQALSVALEPVPAAMFPTDAAAVVLTCWPRGEPMFSVGARLPPRLSGRQRLPGSVWERAVRTGEVIVCPSLDQLDPETARLAADAGLSNLLVVPMGALGSGVVGLLVIWGVQGRPPAEGLRGLGLMVGDLVVTAVRLREQFDDLHRSARSDPLTGLANRTAFEEAFAAGDDADAVAVLYVDLDRFKAVNDRHGHLVGDELLGVVARRMSAQVRDEDLVARLGGDEFAVLCPGCGRDEAMRVADRVIAAVREPIAIGDIHIEIEASVGVAYDVTRRADLLRRADDALYDAKAAGRGRAHVAGPP